MSLATFVFTLKSATITLLLFLIVVLIREAKVSVSGRLAIALAIGALAQSIGVVQDPEQIAGWRTPLIALATGNVVVL